MNFSQNDSVKILQALGYEPSLQHNFKLRNEKTASASINPKNGKIKDFGTGWYGSVIDLMTEYHNMSLHEALKFANSILENENHTYKKINFSQSEASLKLIDENSIKKFEIARKNNFSVYWKLLKNLLPVASDEQRKKIAQKYQIGFIEKSGRLIMPIRDLDEKIITFWKYTPFPKIFINSEGKNITSKKVLFSKGRPRIPFNLQILKNFNKENKLYIFEGEKDCLNAISCGLNAITIGSASSKLDEKYLKFFKDLKIRIIYDVDLAGSYGALNLQNQLNEISEEVKIINLEKLALKIDPNFEIKKGFDYTNYLVFKYNSGIIKN